MSNFNMVDDFLKQVTSFDNNWIDEDWSAACETKTTKKSNKPIQNDDIDEFLNELELKNKNEKIKEFNMNDDDYFDEYMEASLEPMIKEILVHFSKRYRKSSDDDPYDQDARYLYKQKEVDLFFKMNTNSNLMVKPMFEKGKTKPWCWKISRIDKKK